MKKKEEMGSSYGEGMCMDLISCCGSIFKLDDRTKQARCICRAVLYLSSLGGSSSIP
jgi:hypothetical protein